MNTECPKCGYVRSIADQAPEFECPRCGIVYEKYRQKAETTSPRSDPGPPLAEIAGSDAALGKFPGSKKSKFGYDHLSYLLIIVISASLLIKLFLWPSDKGVPSAEKQPSAQNFAYDIRGEYTGIGKHHKFDIDFTYRAQIVIGSDYRVSSATWTVLNSKGINATAHWSPPATIEYTCQREKSKEHLSLNDQRLSVSMTAEEGSCSPACNFDLVYDYEDMAMADTARPDGNFTLDPENGCITASIAAVIPAIQSAHITEQQLDVDFTKWHLIRAVDDAALTILEGKLGLSRIGKPGPGGTVTGFTLTGAVLNFYINPLPFICNLKMHNSFKRTVDDVSILNPQETAYTLTTEPVHWDIEITFCPDGAMYALNKDVKVGQGVSRKDQIYLKYLLEKLSRAAS